MNLFKKYPSITNASQKKVIDYIRMNLPEQTWIVSEKIHGANFQIIFDENNNISFASRNQLLDEFSSFYDLPGLKRVENNGKTLIQRVTELNDYLRSFYGPTLKVVNLFGEYAGTLTAGNKIQKEVDYGTQEFYLFDIFLTFVNEDAEVPLAVNKETVKILANTYGLASPVILLQTNNLDEALSFPNDFDSISGNLKYNQELYYKEKLTFTGKNITEGVVIEPTEVTFARFGRIILKNKNQKFSENHTSKPIKKESILPEEEQKFLEQIIGYANVNRVSNVCSHLGISEREELQKVFGNVVKETMLDAIEDIKKDFEDITLLDKVIKLFNKRVAESVREYLISL